MVVTWSSPQKEATVPCPLSYPNFNAYWNSRALKRKWIKYYTMTFSAWKFLGDFGMVWKKWKSSLPFKLSPIWFQSKQPACWLKINWVRSSLCSLQNRRTVKMWINWHTSPRQRSNVATPRRSCKTFYQYWCSVNMMLYRRWCNTARTFSSEYLTP